MTRLDATGAAARTTGRERPPSAPERSFAAALRHARGADRTRARGAGGEPGTEAPGRPPSPAPSADGPGPVTGSSAASLRAVSRAAPVTVALLGAHHTDGLALDLGRALSIELRVSPGGVEVTVRPAPALARVAAAELPGLVRVLRRRGVAVARAEVLPPRVARM